MAESKLSEILTMYKNTDKLSGKSDKKVLITEKIAHEHKNTKLTHIHCTNSFISRLLEAWFWATVVVDIWKNEILRFFFAETSKNSIFLYETFCENETMKICLKGLHKNSKVFIIFLLKSKNKLNIASYSSCEKHFEISRHFHTNLMDKLDSVSWKIWKPMRNWWPAIACCKTGCPKRSKTWWLGCKDRWGNTKWNGGRN